MRRIPTLLEVERRHVLNTLHLCGNNRSHTAKVLGLSLRDLRTKLHQYEKAGFAIGIPLARAEVNVDASTRRRESPQRESATIKVIEELISVVEAITESARPDDGDGRQTTRRKEKS